MFSWEEVRRLLAHSIVREVLHMNVPWLTQSSKCLSSRPTQRCAVIDAELEMFELQADAEAAKVVRDAEATEATMQAEPMADEAQRQAANAKRKAEAADAKRQAQEAKDKAAFMNKQAQIEAKLRKQQLQNKALWRNKQQLVSSERSSSISSRTTSRRGSFLVPSWQRLRCSSYMGDGFGSAGVFRAGVPEKPLLGRG